MGNGNAEVIGGAQKGLSWWQDRVWWKKNWWTVVVAFGAVITIILTNHTMSENVRDNCTAIQEHAVEIDSLDKKHNRLEQSFSSYRENVEEDLEEMAEDIEDLADDQASSYIVLVRIADRMGVSTDP